MQGAASILAFDSDPRMLVLIERWLERENFTLLKTDDPDDVPDLILDGNPALILVDVDLPAGRLLLSRARSLTTAPILATATYPSDTRCAQVLEVGADDVISKPFSQELLLAHVHALLRRSRLTSAMERYHILEDLTIDLLEPNVFRGDQRLALSATEYRLLQVLALNSGRVMTQSQLLRLVWGEEYEGGSTLLRSFIRNLRKRLGDDARNPRYIKTDRQVGYWMP
jgi:two-component system, OmpR family, KDP operon response regulator KdpE